MGYDWTGKRTRRIKMLRGCAVTLLAGTLVFFLAAALVK